MIRITDIIDKITENNPDADVDIIDRAYIYSARVHDGQVRLSGEPYLSHPLEVAGILADMKLDAVSIAAGLLHDVIEDTHATGEEIKDMFGQDVYHIVSGVTKLSALTFGSYKERQAESIKRMLLAMADDIRVILIKLADRLHNMRTLQFHKNPEKINKIAGETIDIYAPIAARLGIYWIKNELENTSFIYLHPEAHTKINDRIIKEKGEREKYIEKIKKYIDQKMAEHHLECRVTGRYKSPYSIYQKMIDQNLAFEDVYDIIAFRIILHTISQCYEVLGILHSLWKPIDIKFKDYIGRPKPNMYQSLHTTVIGDSGERIEIQIRTYEMDHVAQSGIAAHWSYKEGLPIDKNTSKTFSWIQNLVENQENIGDPEEFLENVKIDLFPDEVYVFTPGGEIKTLPKGATPVDFAYLIHTEVGNQCSGSKVNGHIVPLKYELHTGDIVEILTSKKRHPSKDWLNFVKTIKARSKIRQWIKTQEKDRSLSLGWEMCEKAFRKYNLDFAVHLKSKKMEQVVADFGFNNIDNLIESVGYGKTTPVQIIRKLVPESETQDKEHVLEKFLFPEKKKKQGTGVLVKGIDDVLIRFGKCCQPVPGDSITGYITQGFGVTIHRKHCVNALKMNPERQIDVIWNQNIPENYTVKMNVESTDRLGLLAEMAASISKNDAQIIHADIKTLENDAVKNVFIISVKDTDHLNRIIMEIKKIKGILDVGRI
jgi:GTP pyrophosphokinase